MAKSSKKTAKKRKTASKKSFSAVALPSQTAPVLTTGSVSATGPTFVINPPMPAFPAPIHALPNETLDEILSYLDDKDIVNLRSSSKFFFSTTNLRFYSRFEEYVCTLDAKHIRKLLKIVSQQHVAQHIKTLMFAIIGSNKMEQFEKPIGKIVDQIAAKGLSIDMGVRYARAPTRYQRIEEKAPTLVDDFTHEILFPAIELCNYRLPCFVVDIDCGPHANKATKVWLAHRKIMAWLDYAATLPLDYDIKIRFFDRRNPKPHFVTGTAYSSSKTRSLVMRDMTLIQFETISLFTRNLRLESLEVHNGDVTEEWIEHLGVSEKVRLQRLVLQNVCLYKERPFYRAISLASWSGALGRLVAGPYASNLRHVCLAKLFRGKRFKWLWLDESVEFVGKEEVKKGVEELDLHHGDEVLV